MSGLCPAGGSASVEVVVGRYPFRPACSCGWTTWGYVADHAARILVDAHVAGERV
jgi:hypothetical protein